MEKNSEMRGQNIYSMKNIKRYDGLFCFIDAHKFHIQISKNKSNAVKHP